MASEQTCELFCCSSNNSRRSFFYIVLFSSALWKFLFFIRNSFLYAIFPFIRCEARERETAGINFETIDSLPANNCWSWIWLMRAKQTLMVLMCSFLCFLHSRPQRLLGAWVLRPPGGSGDENVFSNDLLSLICLNEDHHMGQLLKILS